MRDIFCERRERAAALADEAWDGASHYIISDGGKEPVWCDSKAELAAEIDAALDETPDVSATMVSPFYEDAFLAFFGDLTDDLDLDAIVDETTRIIDGKRWTTVFGDDFDEVVRRNER